MVVAAAPGALTCLRSLHRRNVNTIVFSHDADAPSLRSRFCNEGVLVPSPFTDVDEFADAILSLAVRDDVRAIIPSREQDAYVLSKYRDQFANHVSPLWPSFETLRLVHDRNELVQGATEAGVAVPQTWTLDEFEGGVGNCVVKPRYSLLTADYVDTIPPDRVDLVDSVIFTSDGSELDREMITTEMGHVPIVQEHIPGEEYGFWALYNDGEAVATCLKRQVRGLSYSGGTSVYRETVHDPRLEETGRTLLDHLDWHGLASVQFKRHADTGEYTLLEINPRIWTSMSCPVRAGVDIPYYFWQLTTGEEPAPRTTYDEGVGTHRLGGEIAYLQSVLTEEHPIVEPPPVGSAVRSVVRSVIQQPAFDYLSLHDPYPFVRDVLNNIDYLGSVR